MTLGELIARTRELLDDTHPDAYLWQDEDLIAYANSAEREACRRADLLIDSITPTVCRINLSAGVANYNLSPLIIKIKRVILNSNNKLLFHTRTIDLDTDNPYWDLVTGEPTHYITDHMSNAIRLYPTPVASDILILTVSRYPLSDMALYDSVPEIDEQYHFGLIDWMCHLAYMKQDAETIDLIKAKSFQQFFNEKFGLRPSAMTEVYRKTLPGHLYIRPQRFGG